MENISGKGLSRIPWIMLVLTIYLGYKSFFHDKNTNKVYVISASPETAPRKDTIQPKLDNIMPPIPGEWPTVINSSAPLVTQAVQNSKSNSADKPALAFSPRVAPKEEVVKNLLDQGETIDEIAGQTGLKKKEIRKIKRKKKAEERKDRKSRKRLQ